MNLMKSIVHELESLHRSFQYLWPGGRVVLHQALLDGIIFYHN